MEASDQGLSEAETAAWVVPLVMVILIIIVSLCLIGTMIGLCGVFCALICIFATVTWRHHTPGQTVAAPGG